MPNKEGYPVGPREFVGAMRDLARTAVRHLTTQPLATHGDHNFDRNHQAIPRPTHFDEVDMGQFPQFYGEVTDQRLGPPMYDRQGFPIYPDDIEFMRNEQIG